MIGECHVVEVVVDVCRREAIVATTCNGNNPQHTTRALREIQELDLRELQVCVVCVVVVVDVVLRQR